MELTIPFAELMTTCRRSWGSLATTSPSPRDVCCHGKKIAAKVKPNNNKNVTLATNLANQLDRTKCMAGNRSPRDWVGRKRIILRGSVSENAGFAGSNFGDCDSINMVLVSGILSKQIHVAIALLDDLRIAGR